MPLTVAYLSQGRLLVKEPDKSAREIESPFAKETEQRQAKARSIDGWKGRSGVWGQMGMAPPEWSQWEQAGMDGARRVAQNTPIQLQAARVLEQQSRARYDAGLATIIEVADSQRLLLQAEVGDAVARLGVWRALLADAAAKGDLSELLK